MRCTTLVVLCAAVALFTPNPAVAVDGAIPIWKATTITASGSYVVTRDIGCPAPSSPTAITIQADGVEVDLNGFKLCSGEPVIYAEGVSRIRVHNGTIESYEESINFVDVTEFAIHDLMIQGYEDVCMVNLTGTEGTFEKNALRGDHGTLCVGGSQMVVRDNRVSPSFGVFGGDIRIEECVDCQVLGNTAVAITAGMMGGIIAGNTISHQLVVSGTDNRVLDNVVTSGSGTEISGDRNQIEGNLFNANSGYGLKITGKDCVFRSNTARSNGGTGCTGTASGNDYCDEGINNTSHGDNYMPNLM
jgi:hypothetical protein